MFDTVTQRAVDLAFCGLAFERFAFVVLGLALAETELDFGETLGEVNPQWHQRHPFGVELTGKSMNFLSVEQQATWPKRVNIPAVAEFVRGDVRVVQPALVAFDSSEGVIDGRAGVAEALDLGAFQFDAGLERFADEVVSTRFVVVNRRRHGRQYITAVI